MQIQHQGMTSSPQVERGTQLKEGDIYKATVKQINKDEAVLSIRGKEVPVKFEGSLPTSDRVNIQVIDNKSDVMRVKVVEDSKGSAQTNSSEGNQSKRQSDVVQTLRQLGVNQPTAELKQAASTLLNKGVDLSPESVQELQRFLSKGPIEQKMQTIEALANKRLDVTANHLKAVDEALNGRSFNHVLNDLAKELDQDFNVQPRERQSEGSNKVTSPQEIRNLVNNGSIKQAIEKLGTVVNDLPNTSDMDGIKRSSEQLSAEARQLNRVAIDRVVQALPQDVAESEMVQQLRNLIARDGITPEVRSQLSALTENQSNELLNRAVKQALQLQQVAGEKILQSLNLVEQLSSSKNINLDQVNKPNATFLQQTMSMLQKEPVFEKILQSIQAQLDGIELPETSKQSLRQIIEHAASLNTQGRELKARQELSNGLQQLEQTIQTNQALAVPKEAAYAQDDLLHSMQAASKAIAVTTVTEKMAQMTGDFKSLQREVNRTLDQATRLLDQFRNQAQSQVKPMLEATIKKLDHAILKSEMMLFTDMKTERQLMQASSQLTEAKKLLAKGQHVEANKIVKEVTQLVDKVHFQPSDTKVKHYTAAREMALRDLSPEQAVPRQIAEIARGPVQESSPRAMLEMVRMLGLNRDSEMAQQLANGGREQQQNADQNLKSMLLQLARGEEEGTRVQQLANQALNNVTGQQLLSRSDQQGMQSLFFQLPMLLENNVENLQVFVNSRNEGQEVDWENCSIYFLMQTPKMGDIGILVSAKDRQLSVTMKNDQQNFKEKMTPLVQHAVDKLVDIGYSINDIKYSPLKTEEAKKELSTDPKQSNAATSYGKGFDLKI